MKFFVILITTLLIVICITSFLFGFYVSEDKGHKQQPQKRQDTMSIQFQSYPLYTAKCTKSNNNFCEEYSVFRVYTRN